MALIKEIELETGIVVKYHRIVSINKITNNQTIVEIGSYISQAKREEEITAIENNEKMNVFIYTSYILKNYNETDTIQDLYEYLKTTERYTGAVSV